MYVVLARAIIEAALSLTLLMPLYPLHRPLVTFVRRFFSFQGTPSLARMDRPSHLSYTAWARVFVVRLVFLREFRLDLFSFLGRSSFFDGDSLFSGGGVFDRGRGVFDGNRLDVLWAVLMRSLLSAHVPCIFEFSPQPVVPIVLGFGNTSKHASFMYLIALHAILCRSSTSSD